MWWMPSWRALEVDTACQPQHYRGLVGEALRTLAAEHGIGRGAVWLQTKFTPALHQGADVPYDPGGAAVGPGRAERPGVAQICRSLLWMRAAPRPPGDARTDHGGLRAMERQVEWAS